ncbi:MAG: sulfatase [Coxiella sp. (in: Bacteria)]|nr:MAG: sulfatase [Coxiella sp. (in: g-proteobacteria)]
MLLMKYGHFLIMSLLVFSPSVFGNDVKHVHSSCQCSNLPKRFQSSSMQQQPGQPMVKIPGGIFMMGGDNNQAKKDELPKHKVQIKSFWLDKTEVTNKQFSEFIKATGYKTTAERKPDWNKLKKNLPPNTPKPGKDVLVPSSLVFTPPNHKASLINHHKWWEWKKGADWRHPNGPNSNITGKENHPVVHVSWLDAAAYCNWRGVRLPTEAEWEWSARGGLKNKLYPWGNEAIDQGTIKANTWQGSFPHKNTLRDKHYYTAAVKSFKPNGYGLYDMSGNVWEWVSDLYHARYYYELTKKNAVNNPTGPRVSYDPRDPNIKKNVTRGGSYLCNEKYCTGYRVSARMKSSPDTSMQHTGFRCAK